MLNPALYKITLDCPCCKRKTDQIPANAQCVCLAGHWGGRVGKTEIRRGKKDSKKGANVRYCNNTDDSYSGKLSLGKASEIR